MKKIFSLLATVLTLFVLYSQAVAEEVYTFGIVPQFEQRKLHAIWGPIVSELSRRTGLSFKIETTLQIPEFERKFVDGAFDFVYMNPYHILKAHESQDYNPLVRDSAPLRGVLVVSKSSPVTDVSQLDGKVVAFPSPNALGACLLIRADLERVYNTKVIPLYVKTHSSVYLHVAKGLADAGGGVEKSLQEQDQALKDSLRVLYTTREMPSHPVAVHPRVPLEVQEKVRQAFLDMDKIPEGRELLAKVPIKSAISTSIQDYLPMKTWGLESYWDPFWAD